MARVPGRREADHHKFNAFDWQKQLDELLAEMAREERPELNFAFDLKLPEVDWQGQLDELLKFDWQGQLDELVADLGEQTAELSVGVDWPKLDELLADLDRQTEELLKGYEG